MKNDAARRQASSYPFSIEIQTRFSDVDQQRHVNNVAVADFYQEARIRFHRELRAGEPRLASHRTVVARHEMDYLAEIEYPGSALVGLGVGRIGTTSYTLVCGLFQNERCVGLAATVLVEIGEAGPADISPGIRERLGRYALRESPAAAAE